MLFRRANPGMAVDFSMEDRGVSSRFEELLVRHSRARTMCHEKDPRIVWVSSVNRRSLCSHSAGSRVGGSEWLSSSCDDVCVFDTRSFNTAPDLLFCWQERGSCVVCERKDEREMRGSRLFGITLRATDDRLFVTDQTPIF